MLQNKNLFSQLTKDFKKTQTSPFIKSQDGKILNYQDMMDYSGRYSNALKKIGIKQNDRVLVKAEKRIESIWLYLACLRVGATYIPINPNYTNLETDYFIQDCKPKLFVTDFMKTNMKFEQASVSCEETTVEQLLKVHSDTLELLASNEQSEFETTLCYGAEIAAILYTSGTTGKSKGAMISHLNLFSNTMVLSNVWKLSSKDILLHILPIYHTHGLFVAFNSMIYSKGCILFHKNFVIDEVLKAIMNVTVMMGVPTHYIRLIAEKGFAKLKINNVRLFISGSAPLSAEVHSKFKKITGYEILERYGMTETNMISSNPYNGERRPGTVGFPLPGVTVRIKDTKAKTILKDCSVGSIEVRGPNVFSGYWQMKEGTKAAFTSDGFFITGDLGFFDTSGYLNIVGRDKDLIISGGLNIYPAEVERVIESLPEVSETALVGLPHPDFGEGATAIITLKKINTKINEEDFRNRLGEKIARFKIPLRIIVKHQLPKNAMGKIQKNKLRAEFKNVYAHLRKG